MTVACVLHDLGAEEGRRAWRAVAPEGWEVPDLPGHGATPAPRHGAYDPLGPTTQARWALEGKGLAVGIGQNAHGALILAAGGGCDAVAVVDGLWGPWQDPTVLVDGMYRTLRSMLRDDGAIAAPPRSGLDPRTAHGYGVTMSPEFAQRFWGSVTCPVLAVETPASTTPPAERAERVRWFGDRATLLEVGEADEARVVQEISTWWDGVS